MPEVNYNDPNDDDETEENDTEENDDDGPRTFERGHVGEGGRIGERRHERGKGA